MGTVLGFAVLTVVSGTFLWAGMKLTRVNGTLPGMLAIAFLAGIAGLVPIVGWILSFVVMLVLVCKWTDAELWPDAILMVLVARLLAVGAAFLLAGAPAGPA